MPFPAYSPEQRRKALTRDEFEELAPNKWVEKQIALLEAKKITAQEMFAHLLVIPTPNHWPKEFKKKYGEGNDEGRAKLLYAAVNFLERQATRRQDPISLAVVFKILTEAKLKAHLATLQHLKPLVDREFRMEEAKYLKALRTRKRSSRQARPLWGRAMMQIDALLEQMSEVPSPPTFKLAHKRPQSNTADIATWARRHLIEAGVKHIQRGWKDALVGCPTRPTFYRALLMAIGVVPYRITDGPIA